MFKTLRRFLWNRKYHRERHGSSALVHERHFPNLKLGESFFDGMSADPTVFLNASVESVTKEEVRIRVRYSVSYKATTDATGSFDLVVKDGELSELCCN